MAWVILGHWYLLFISSERDNENACGALFCQTKDHGMFSESDLVSIAVVLLR